MASKDDLVAEALRITSLYAEAEELKQQAGRAVTAFAELVEVWFDDASRREVLDLQEFLYWDTDIPYRGWPKALGIKRTFADASGGHPNPTLRTRMFPFLCRVCGGSFENETYSRTERDNGIGECPDCKAGAADRQREQRARGEAWLAERQAELFELKTMPYGEYLQTDHWQRIRTGALRRAGYRCATCNASGVTLDVHHRTYERRGQEYASDVIALCRQCHSRFHGAGS